MAENPNFGTEEDKQSWYEFIANEAASEYDLEYAADKVAVVAVTHHRSVEPQTSTR